jgi:hypothetical protein
MKDFFFTSSLQAYKRNNVRERNKLREVNLLIYSKYVRSWLSLRITKQKTLIAKEVRHIGCILFIFLYV